MLETARFTTRLPTAQDLPDWHKLLVDPEVMRFIRKKPMNETEVKSLYLDPSIQHGLKHGFSSCSTFSKETGKFAGCMGIFYYGFDESQPEIEIGCILHKDYWGKGAAVELAQGCIDWAFTHLSIPRLIAVANPLNRNSWRCMQKLGMQCVGNELYCNKYDVIRYEIYRPESK
jgi:ribosomal-protein-alanine N-acetyltransferase